MIWLSGYLHAGSVAAVLLAIAAWLALWTFAQGLKHYTSGNRIVVRA